MSHLHPALLHLLYTPLVYRCQRQTLMRKLQKLVTDGTVPTTPKRKSQFLVAAPEETPVIAPPPRNFKRVLPGPPSDKLHGRTRRCRTHLVPHHSPAAGPQEGLEHQAAVKTSHLFASPEEMS